MKNAKKIQIFSCLCLIIAGKASGAAYGWDDPAMGDLDPNLVAWVMSLPVNERGAVIEQHRVAREQIAWQRQQEADRQARILEEHRAVRAQGAARIAQQKEEEEEANRRAIAAFLE